MQKSLQRVGMRALGAVLVVSSALGAGVAHAGDVYWSVGIDAPTDGAGRVRTHVGNVPPAPRVVVPPVVVAAPPPVVVHPGYPVYAEPPRPVIVAPAPIVYERGWPEGRHRWCEEERAERYWRWRHRGWGHDREWGRWGDRDDRWGRR